MCTQGGRSSPGGKGVPGEGLGVQSRGHSLPGSPRCSAALGQDGADVKEPVILESRLMLTLAF